MNTLNFRFELCGTPGRLYFVDDGGDRSRPIQQCLSRPATEIEARLWGALWSATEELKPKATIRIAVEEPAVIPPMPTDEPAAEKLIKRPTRRQ